MHSIEDFVTPYRCQESKQLLSLFVSITLCAHYFVSKSFVRCKVSKYTLEISGYTDCSPFLYSEWHMYAHDIGLPKMSHPSTVPFFISRLQTILQQTEVPYFPLIKYISLLPHPLFFLTSYNC